MKEGNVVFATFDCYLVEQTLRNILKYLCCLPYMTTTGGPALQLESSIRRPYRSCSLSLAKGNADALGDTYFQSNLKDPLQSSVARCPSNGPSCSFLKPAVMTLPSHPPTQQQYVAMCSFQ